MEKKVGKVKTKISTVGKIKTSKGFTFLVILAVVVVMGISADATVRLTSTVLKREKEQELLFRGQAYIKAIGSYYLSGKTINSFPKKLEDLLKDSRYIQKRHLRKLYPDPFTNKADWKLLRNKEGGITGVVSRSEGIPLKTANFPIGLESFEQAATYSDWRFEFISIFE